MKCAESCAYLIRRQPVTPVLQQLCVHRVRTTFLDFSQSTEDAELVISHSHVSLVGLNVGVRERFELGCRDSIQESGIWKFSDNVAEARRITNSVRTGRS